MHETDNLGRKIFYYGPRGPLPGPLIVTEKSGTEQFAGRSLFFANVNPSVEKVSSLEGIITVDIGRSIRKIGSKAEEILELCAFRSDVDIVTSRC